MAHFNRSRRSASRPAGGRFRGWKLVALTTRLTVVVLAIVVCLSKWGPAQERSPKSGPATSTPHVDVAHEVRRADNASASR